jgi:hypothetical protein
VDLPLTLSAIQQEREAEIASLELAAAAKARDRVHVDLGSHPRPTAAPLGSRVTRRFTSVLAWAGQIRSLAP